VVDINKLREYTLNPDHPKGKHKARVLKSALGITQNDAEWLKQQALHAALNGDASSSYQSPFGDKYAIDVEIQYGERSATVRFSWIIEHGTDFPRLTSCYIK
jgi:hypothetical protein